MTSRLPIPGSDDGQWGTILNDYLSVEHNTDGTLKNAVRPSSLAPIAITGSYTDLTNTPAIPTRATDIGAAPLNSPVFTGTPVLSGSPLLTRADGNAAYSPLSADWTGGATGAVVRSLSSKMADVLSVRDFNAKGDGSTDDTSAIQAALNAAAALGGGAVYFPPGNYRAANLLWPDHVGLVGPTSTTFQYGFTSSGRLATIHAPSSAPTSTVTAIVITSGGSGYTSIPTVTISGGGGTGATAAANIAGGAFVQVAITDPGSGYTNVPTVTISGGGGSGATARAVVSTPILYTTGTPRTNIGIEGIALVAGTSGVNQGVVIHDAYKPVISHIHAYGFNAEAVWIMGGAAAIVETSTLFGGSLSNPGYATGALRLGGSDVQVTNLEVGGGPSGDQTNLWNAACFLEGGGQIVNCVFEGADVGMRIQGPQNFITNVRCDINYGHGFLLARLNDGLQPPQMTTLIGCWGHRNGHYATNAFDAFHISAGQSINNATLIGCKSTNFAGDTWTHRYGVYDGGNASCVQSFRDISAAGTAAYSAVNGTAGFDNSNFDMSPTALTVNSGTPDVSGKTRWYTANSSATVITNFLGGADGQTIVVLVKDANTSFGNGAGIYTATGATITAANNCAYQFTNLGGHWRQL